MGIKHDEFHLIDGIIMSGYVRHLEVFLRTLIIMEN
jgi:hypothetical protein